MYILGINPGVQYSGADFLAGKCPKPGTIGQTNDGKVYALCLVAASQNLINGHVVTIDSAFTVTIAAAGPPGPNAANELGVAITSVTASASAYIWVQRFGRTLVQSTASTLPNVTLTMAAAAGFVDDAVATASGVIDGIVLTATTVASGLTAAILNWPKFTTPGQAG